MRFPLAAIVVLSLALVAAGCGSDDDTSTTTNGSAGAASEAPQTSENGAGADKQQAAQRDGGDRAEQGGNGGSESHEEVIERAEKEFEPKPNADNSIQEFGDEQEGEERSEVIDAMFAFFRAMANSDHKAICNGLTSSNVEQLETFLKLKDKQGTCETVLEEVLRAQTPEAKRAANGTVYEVREEDGNAFVLFVPQGGVASYFVMKDENGAWKATSVTTGTPLDPGALAGK